MLKNNNENKSEECCNLKGCVWMEGRAYFKLSNIYQNIDLALQSPPRTNSQTYPKMFAAFTERIFCT